MKTCPVCHSAAFDDAEVCYGCLHPFGVGDSDEPAATKQNRDGETPSRFVVSFVPTLEGGRVTWACSVEQASEA